MLKYSAEHDFIFVFGSKGVKHTLTVPIVIPVQRNVEDLAGRIISAHSIPCYAVKALSDQLETFVSEKTAQFHDDNAQQAVDFLRKGQVDTASLVTRWSKAFSEETSKYAKPDVVSNEALFSEVYHALIHSPALETLLNLEHTYAIAVSDLNTQRDKDLSHLEKRQSDEMDKAVQSLGITYTDENVNQLAQRHFENTQLMESKWASELSNLQETQKREYKQWVMKVYEDTQTRHKPIQYVSMNSFPPSQPVASTDDVADHELMEESFSVHLGAQLKTMHNLRLISADVLEFCKHLQDKRGLAAAQPQRLQTAMSLYSNSLCGLVLLVDNRLNSYVGIKRDFAKVCQQSTEFHFTDLEQQFEQIEQHLVRANEWRAQRAVADDGDKLSMKSTSSNSSNEKDDKSVKMQSGDFYMTRHSNLSEVHVMFHLVTDETLRSPDISSRHPVILGYRNILKCCFRYDVHTITLPLLLSHEMSEEMTVPWCLKRAELVFKCVKGFMMELATWAGQESRTIQFLVPKGLSEETFSSISNMLPSIFRMSNPVVARS